MSKDRTKFEITIGGWCQALGIVFVTLKLLHRISWSWWWVTAPFWMPYVVGLGLLVIVGLISAICSTKSKW